VEEILDSKMKPYGRLAYRVAWKGHPPDRQWYNATGFKNSLELVKAFYDKYLDKPQSLRIKQHVLDQRKEKRNKAQFETLQRRRSTVPEPEA